MSDGNNPITSSYITTTESVLGNAIRAMLDSAEIQVGSSVSYELAKSIFLYHPLGRKMAESPVALAQSQRRRVSVGEAPPEVAKAFEAEWRRMRADRHIANAARIARIYGISSLVLGVDGQSPSIRFGFELHGRDGVSSHHRLDQAVCSDSVSSSPRRILSQMTLTAS